MRNLDPGTDVALAAVPDRCVVPPDEHPLAVGARSGLAIKPHYVSLVSDEVRTSRRTYSQSQWCDERASQTTCGTRPLGTSSERLDRRSAHARSRQRLREWGRRRPSRLRSSAARACLQRLRSPHRSGIGSSVVELNGRIPPGDASMRCLEASDPRTSARRSVTTAEQALSRRRITRAMLLEPSALREARSGLAPPGLTSPPVTGAPRSAGLRRSAAVRSGPRHRHRGDPDCASSGRPGALGSRGGIDEAPPGRRRS